MELEGADDAPGGAFFPARAASLIPLAGELLEGVGGCSDGGCLAGVFGDEGIVAVGGFGSQLSGLLAGEGTAYLGVGAKAKPGPFAVRLLVAEFPGFLPVGLHAEVEAVAVVFAVDGGFWLEGREGRIGQWAALDLLPFHPCMPLVRIFPGIHVWHTRRAELT
ncbi:hypothetical protein FQZ97_989040 [compost metagenome]